MPLLTAPLSPEYRFVPAPVVPRYCTSIVNRLADLYWEKHFNINTRGGAASPHPDAHHYGSLSYHTYFLILDRLALKPSDVVVDLGAGKGRVSCLAASYPIRASIGVEIDPPLCAVAEANRQRMKHRRADLQFVCQSAVDYDYDAVDVVMMFHPFGSATMHQVLHCWQASLERRPRRFRIVYGNPLLSPMLAAKPWLQLRECWLPGQWSRIKFPIHFYENVPSTASTR
jgi:SAM-dependent methyltransferase